MWQIGKRFRVDLVDLVNVQVQLFQVLESLEHVLLDVLDAVPVQVQVLELAESIEGAGDQFSKPVVVEQQGAQRMQVGQHSRLYVADLIEAKVQTVGIGCRLWDRC